jgi:NAD(P)-dependent dehydrogenase (short-subunit alcohol dehydrogenase family)
MKSIVADFGKLDIMLNNTALGMAGQVLNDPTIDNAALNRMWAVNVIGVVAIHDAHQRHLEASLTWMSVLLD